MLASLLPLVASLVPLAASLAQADDPGTPDPRRSFDFWVGEWSVQNRHLQADGTWRDGTRTRARITPVCAGAAILEEWAGPLGEAFMNGFSLRAWDPESAVWKLVLFWTTDGNGAFGQLEGRFRHGRGEFFVPSSGPGRTRYTFSDALADSVRWDSATSADGGVTWRTDWIMEFNRTRPAPETTQQRLFETAWTEGRVSPHARARELDWMLGEWRGVQTLADGRELEARLDCKLLAKDCLVLDLLRTRPLGAGNPAQGWSERLAVRGFEAPAGRWVRWSVSDTDSRLVRAVGRLQDGAMAFQEGGAEEEGDGWVEYLIPLGANRMQIEVARPDPDGGAAVVHSTLLERAPG